MASGSEGFLRILLVDVAGSLDRLDTQSGQASRRDLIRSVFAAIEGLAWLYRMHISSIARDMDVLTDEDELALSERTYQVSENGKVSMQSKYMPLPTAIRFATKIAERLDQALVADFSAEGWSGLKQAVSTRHRITHPKTTADLHVGEDDLSACLAGFFWLLEVVTSAMGSANAQFAEHVQEMRRILDGLEGGDPEIWKEYRSAKSALES